MASRLVAFAFVLFGLLFASCAPLQSAVLEITPSSGTLVSGEVVKLSVSRRFAGGGAEDATGEVTYSTSNRPVAQVSPDGSVTAGDEAGTVEIRVDDTGSNAVGAARFTILTARIDAIDIAPPDATLVPGTSQRFTANARLSNGSTRDVTAEVQWASSNEDVATVGRTPSDFGVVTAVGEGTVVITAADATTGVQGRSNVSVRGAGTPLVSLVVTPNPALIAAGKTLQFAALGVFGDGTSKDLTKSVTWSSARADIVTIDAAGVAKGIVAGDTTITATGLEPSTAIKGSASAKVQ